MSFLVLLLGLGVGLTVGLMGVGGGIVLVPALVYLLHFGQHLAQGTSLFLQLPPIGLGALQTYWKNGHVDLPAGLVCAAGFFAGGYFGSVVALQIPSRQLAMLFGVFLMGAALLLLRQGLDSPRQPGGSSKNADRSGATPSREPRTVEPQE